MAESYNSPSLTQRTAGNFSGDAPAGPFTGSASVFNLFRSNEVMCGIFGVINDTPATQPILAGLARLEYRGYDSAGIATLASGRIDRRRTSGRLSNLVSLIEDEPIVGTIGIGHTRWATHGAP